MNTGGLVTGVDGTLAVIKPEGNVQSGDFFNWLWLLKSLGSKGLPLHSFRKAALASSLLFWKGRTPSGFRPPDSRPGKIVGLPQKGQKVAAVLPSVMSSPPQEEHRNTRTLSGSAQFSCSSASHWNSSFPACWLSFKAWMVSMVNSLSQKGQVSFWVSSWKTSPPPQQGHLYSRTSAMPHHSSLNKHIINGCKNQ